jgi:hypothetical protein
MKIDRTAMCSGPQIAHPQEQLHICLLLAALDVNRNYDGMI